MQIDKKIILKLIKSLEELKNSIKDFKEIDIEAVDSSKDFTNEIIVKSPLVGTAYLAPEPGGKKFVEIGKKIKKGDTIMIVEAMKTMNHIPSTQNGKIKKICVEDGQPVEFDQSLIILE